MDCDTYFHLLLSLRRNLGTNVFLFAAEVSHGAIQRRGNEFVRLNVSSHFLQRSDALVVRHQIVQTLQRLGFHDQVDVQYFIKDEIHISELKNERQVFFLKK